MRELLQEIWSSISRNKLRTFLTGFSIAWGIFMLIILLGSGNGLQNGIMSNLGDEAKNACDLWGGWTSEPYKGYQKWRRIRINLDDAQFLKKEFGDVIDKMAPNYWLSSKTMSYNNNFCSVEIEGTTNQYADIKGYKITEGRFINEADVRENRKVIVLDQMSAQTLFRAEKAEGKMIGVQGTNYTVIGVYKATNFWGSSTVFIPFSTGSILYNNGKNNCDIVFTMIKIKTKEEIENFKDEVRKQLSYRHTFSPTDKDAVRIYDNLSRTMEMQQVFGMINLFIWLIGIGTLIAGVVGVGNIMLVTVKERTAEFGIRKALGARPSSLVKLVLVESLLITGFFGYVGMIAGVGVMELFNIYLENGAAQAAGDSFQIFKNPTLGLSVMVSATIVLMIAGMIAGFVPARRAARLKTIDAMRYNK